MKTGDYIEHWGCRWLVTFAIETAAGWSIMLWREGLPEPVGAFISNGTLPKSAARAEQIEARETIKAIETFKKAGLLTEPDYKGVLDRLRRTVGGETFRTATREEAGF